MKELELLKSYDFKFNKNFGQNFIFDSNLLNAIVSDAGVDKNTTVIEIGTGAGTLTRAIASKAKRVISFEIDRELKPFLEDIFKPYDNIEVRFQDIMKVDLKSFEDDINEKYVMIANLPYYITTPIIFKFLEEANNLTAMYIMVQLEVAERLTAKAGTSEYGAITPAIEIIGDARISRKVSRNMFTPKPNVDSAIVEIKLNKNKYEIADLSLVKKVITASFQMRRKTLTNNLKMAFGKDVQFWAELLESLGFSKTVRGETLSALDFVNLANKINELKIK